MLSDEVFARAMKELEYKPTCLKCLKTVWPLVKNFSFEGNKKWVIPRPTYPYTISYCSSLEPDFVAEDKVILQPYSHKTLRRVFKQLGLVPCKLHGKGSITVKARPKNKKS